MLLSLRLAPSVSQARNGRYIAIIGADGVGVSHSSSLICIFPAIRPRPPAGPISGYFARSTRVDRRIRAD
jgi:hypothetical protein